MSYVLAYVKDQQAVLKTGLVNPPVIRTEEMKDIIFHRARQGQGSHCGDDRACRGPLLPRPSFNRNANVLRLRTSGTQTDCMAVTPMRYSIKAPIHYITMFPVMIFFCAGEASSSVKRLSKKHGFPPEIIPP
jgi:hypothetical protein